MTVEEAIEKLKFDMAMCKFNPLTGEEEFMSEDNRLAYEADKIAIEALKKQKKITVAEKIFDAEQEMLVGLCPNCKKMVDEIFDFCGFCGQALDWTKEAK